MHSDQNNLMLSIIKKLTADAPQHFKELLIIFNKLGGLDSALRETIKDTATSVNVALALNAVCIAFVEKAPVKEIKLFTQQLGEEDLNLPLLINIENALRKREQLENKAFLDKKEAPKYYYPTLITNIVEILNENIKKDTINNRTQLPLNKLNRAQLNNELETYCIEHTKYKALFLYNHLQKLPLKLLFLPLTKTCPPKPSKVVGTIQDPSKGMEESLNKIKDIVSVHADIPKKSLDKKQETLMNLRSKP